jgi:hypothetical protein
MYIVWNYNLSLQTKKKVTDSQRKFGLDGNGNPNYGREAVGFVSFKIQLSTRSWPLDWTSHFVQERKWDAPSGLDVALGLCRLHIMVVQVKRLYEFMAKGLDLGLGFWKLHTLPSRRLHLLYFIGYVFSAHFFGLPQKVWPLTQSHDLSTWTAIVWSGPQWHGYCMA